MADGRVRPVFKWPGGKFRLLDAILEELPEGGRLVEPFAGSGAVFLNSRHDAYVLADSNADVVGFHRDLLEGGGEFIDSCRELFRDGNDAAVYYRRRDEFNALPPGGRSALFLYLNRHGYNGLVRYNARGNFNVPFGRHASPRFPGDSMRAFLEKAALVDLTLLCADFRETFALVRPGDAVYCDPPYYPLSKTANFTAYDGSVFGFEQQAALAALAFHAREAGAHPVLSNHDIPEVRALYARARRIRTLSVRRSISCDAATRRDIAELLAVF